MNETSTKVRKWTVGDYHRMLNAGILAEDAKRSYDYLKPLLSGRALVRSQSPITLSSHSEPPPDIAVVVIDELEYSDRHPGPNEIFLLIEVADSTLVRDLREKAIAYALAQIQDYWVVDVRGRIVHVLGYPASGIYQQKHVLGEGDVLSLLVPDIDVSMNQLLPLGFG